LFVGWQLVAASTQIILCLQTDRFIQL